MQLVLRLVLLANKNGQPLHVVTNEGWTAHPVAVSSSFRYVGCTPMALAGSPHANK